MSHEHDSDEGLAAAIAEHERKIILDATQNTFNSVNDPIYQNLSYADTGELFDFKAELQGKVVGDVGSGCGALAKTAFLEGIDTIVWSINPTFRLPATRKIFDQGFTQQVLPQWYPELPPERFAEAQAYHDAHHSSDFAHNLGFADNKFGLLVDVNAVHKYMPKHSPVYRVTMREMLRVLKPGGKMLVIVDKDLSNETDMPEGMSSEEARLQQLGIRYRLLNKPPTKTKSFFAAMLYKPSP